MDKVNVVWKTYHAPEVIGRGYWDQGLLEDIFKQGNYEHFTEIDQIPQGEGADWQGAIFIINGRTHTEDAEKINADIAKLRWVLFIETGDEEASFPWRDIKHPIMRVWMMLPRMNEHNDTHFKLPNGYRVGTPDVLKAIDYKEKTIDFSFVGQVNHDRREQCVEAAKELLPIYNGVVTTTDAFGKEALNQRGYMELMAKSKIVLCPSGIESPDNFRLYEALEAGCVPVVDAFSSRHKHPGFWRYLFGNNIPFPILDYWDALPKLMPELLRDYPANANRCFAWWQLKKRQIRLQLEDDIKELSK